MLFDLGGACGMRESWHGYRVALETVPGQLVCGLPGPSTFAPRIVVPAATELDWALADQLDQWLETGSCLLFECAAAWVNPGQFSRLRKCFESYFGFSIAPAVDLWKGSANRVPYIEYCWPYATQVRDFSRVTPVLATAGEVIARVDGIPVGLMRKVGEGRLIFLGSMLGPVLFSGDREAREWLGRALGLG